MIADLVPSERSIDLANELIYGLSGATNTVVLYFFLYIPFWDGVYTEMPAAVQSRNLSSLIQRRPCIYLQPVAVVCANNYALIAYRG